MGNSVGSVESSIAIYGCAMVETCNSNYLQNVTGLLQSRIAMASLWPVSVWLHRVRLEVHRHTHTHTRPGNARLLHLPSIFFYLCRWSHDEKYFARMSDNLLSVYSVPVSVSSTWHVEVT